MAYKITKKQIGYLIHLIKENNIILTTSIDNIMKNYVDYSEIYSLNSQEASKLIHFFKVELKELDGKAELINRVYEMQEYLQFYLPDEQWNRAKESRY